MSRFNVPFPVRLHLDGCLLPSWECVKVIRENEEICIFQDGPVSCKNKPASETVVAMITQAEANVSSEVSEWNGEDKTLKNKRKKGKRKHLQHEDDFTADDISPNSATSALEANTKEEGQMYPVSSEMTEDTGQSTYIVLETKNKEGVSEQTSHRKTDLKVGSEELECTAMDLAIRRTLASLTPSPTTIDASHSGSKNDITKTSSQKKRRKRTKKRKSNSNTSQSESFQDSSALCASTPTCEKPVEYKVTYFGAKHMKFGESDEEETTLEQSMPENSALVSAASTTNSQTNTTAESGYNSTQKNMSASHNESNHKDTLPTCVNSRQNGKSEPDAASQVSQPTSSDTSAVGSSVECVATFQKGPFANAKVFNRKQNKKAGSVPLTKEEQLSSVASSTSLKFHQKKSSDTSAKTCSASHVETISLRKADESTKLCIKDYSVYPDLMGPPRPGDVIAYKVLEMSENYCPELSDYKEAKVLSYDFKSQEIELELLTLNQVKKKGRFDVLIEDEDCIITNTEEPEAKMKIPLASLNQPKLIT